MKTVSTLPSDRPAPAFGLTGAGQGILASLIPLAALVIGVSATFLLGLLALSLTGSVAFAARQIIMVLLIAAGLLVSAVVYTIACVRALRQVKQWQSVGAARQATGALWILAITALVVLSPVLIVLLLPAPAP